MRRSSLLSCIAGGQRADCSCGSGTPTSPKQLSKSFFTIGDKAKDKNDYVIHNAKTGVLSYDADGSGRGKAGEFAQLSKKLPITDKDFFVI